MISRQLRGGPNTAPLAKRPTNPRRRVRYTVTSLSRKSSQDDPESSKSATAEQSRGIPNLLFSRALTKLTTFTTALLDEEEEDVERMDQFEQADDLRFEDPASYSSVHRELVSCSLGVVATNAARQ